MFTNTRDRLKPVFPENPQIHFNAFGNEPGQNAHKTRQPGQNNARQREGYDRQSDYPPCPAVTADKPQSAADVG